MAEAAAVKSGHQASETINRWAGVKRAALGGIEMGERREQNSRRIGENAASGEHGETRPSSGGRGARPTNDQISSAVLVSRGNAFFRALSAAGVTMENHDGAYVR